MIRNIQHTSTETSLPESWVMRFFYYKIKLK